MTRYLIQFTKRAEDDAVKLDASIFDRIKLAVETKLTAEPYQLGEPLRYSLRHLRKLRVGDWRVIYKITEATVVIFTIRHRKKGYDDLS